MNGRFWMTGFAAALGLAFNLAAYGETYTYDNTGRLTSVTYDDGSSITYAYESDAVLYLQENGAPADPVQATEVTHPHKPIIMKYHS